MGPTPITAPYRLRLLYTTTLFQHACQGFCDVVASADPSGWDLEQVFGGSSIGLQTAVDLFFTKIAPFYNPSWAAFDGWVLEVRSGTQFFFVDSGVTSVVPTGASAFEIANGLTLSGKDDDQRNMPFFIYEGSFGSATKISAPGALGTPARALMNYVFNADATAAAASMYFWRQARSGAPAKRWLAWVTDTNEKLRRERRIK